MIEFEYEFIDDISSRHYFGFTHRIEIENYPMYIDIFR